MATTTFTAGSEVIYRHEGQDHRAHVTEVDAKTGDVLGLSVRDDNGQIMFGVQKPKLGTIAQHQITDGYFRSRI